MPDTQRKPRTSAERQAALRARARSLVAHTGDVSALTAESDSVVLEALAFAFRNDLLVELERLADELLRRTRDRRRALLEEMLKQDQTATAGG